MSPLDGQDPASHDPPEHADPPGPAFRSLGFTLSTLGFAVSRGFHETLEPLGIEPRDFALLRAVAADEGRSQQVIGERLKIAPSRMVAFVDLLESRGLLERRLNADDRRTRALHLTDAGRDLLGRAFSLAVAYERSLCGDLTDAERTQVLDLLARVGHRLGLPPGVHAAHADTALPDRTPARQRR